MKKNLIPFLIITAVACAGNAWADEAALQKEIDQLKQRLGELEGRKEASEIGWSRRIGDHSQ